MRSPIPSLIPSFLSSITIVPVSFPQYSQNYPLTVPIFKLFYSQKHSQISPTIVPNNSQPAPKIAKDLNKSSCIVLQNGILQKTKQCRKANRAAKINPGIII